MIAKNLSKEAVFDLVQRLLEYYQQNALQRERTARFMERIGMDTLKAELMVLLPYIALDNITPRL
jgi:NAD(P)H-nitrite reductase large subunit